jgi:hypothetical protein
MIEKERLIEAGKLAWYVVRKSPGDKPDGRVIDCVRASSIDVAFEWAMGKWANAISRSHDADSNGEGTYCISVWPMAAQQGRPIRIVQPTKAEIAKFAATLNRSHFTLIDTSL